LVPILDPHQFALDDEASADRLPHCWQVTSDSIAARVAIVAEAAEVILLKSISIPEEMDWKEAARHGYVDPHLAQFAGKVCGPVIRVLNFRELG
jgi:hypothetical protein